MMLTLTLVASLLMQIPLLKLVGGIALLVIAIRLLRDEEGTSEGYEAPAAFDFHTALTTVIIADVVMSVDNVVALAALSKGSILVLVLGLLGSVPFLMYGSLWVMRWLERYPLLVQLGGALLGWVAGDVAITDPLYADWVNAQAPGLLVVAPFLAAAYVLLQARIIDANSERARAWRPEPLVRRGPRRAVQEAMAHREPAGVAVAPEVFAAVLPAADTPRDVGVVAERSAEGLQAAQPVEPLPTIAAPATAVPDAPAAQATTGAAADGQELRDEVAADVDEAADTPLWRSGGAWLAVGGVALTIGAIVVLRGMDFMPAPKNLMRYDCTQGGVSIYYRFGGNSIRIEAANASANGTVRADNQIDWGDLHATSRTLGFVPPTRVLNASAYSLGIDGGMFEQVACTAR